MACALPSVNTSSSASSLRRKKITAAIGTDGAQLAKEIVENELVMDTDVYKDGHIVYLANPTVWYTAEGGITALDIMLGDLEGALLAE